MYVHMYINFSANKRFEMKCAVFNCENIKKYNINLSFFRFPKENKLKKQWAQFCHLDEKKLKVSHRVCIEHFKADDIKGDLKLKMGFGARRFLKPSAVPSIHVKPTSRTSEIRQERLQKRNRKKIVATLLEEHISTCSNEVSTEKLNGTEEHMMVENEVKEETILVLPENDKIHYDDNTPEKRTVKFKLIAEIRKRRALWDTQSKERRSFLSVPEMWKDLAASMGSDVSTCKRDWESLCMVHRATSKRIKSRIKEDKLKGAYGPNKKYSSKWAYFETMQFMDNVKVEPEVDIKPYIYLPDDNETDSQVISRQFHNVENIKKEPEVDLDPEVYLPDDDTDNTDSQMYSEKSHNIDNIKKEPAADLEPEIYLPDDDNDNTDSQMYSEKSHNIDNIKKEPELDLDPDVYLPDDEVDDTGSQMYSEEFLSEGEEMQTAQSKKSPQSAVDINSFNNNNLSEENSLQSQESAKDKPSSKGGNCTKRSYDQVNISEDHEKEEHNLGKSVRLDIKSSNAMDNVGDSDYNFLVGLLPQMKKMNELQNLKFRANMTDLMLDIISQSNN